MKLYRFRHSPYARKVQTVLELLGLPYQAIDVSYGERNELATLTNGYIYVPVLVTEDGTVIKDSRAICVHLLARKGAEWLAPSPLEGPIWGYADFLEGPVEDLLFRVGSPDTRDQWPTPSDRALYVMNKERKFGAGCIDAWQRDRAQLIARAQDLLEPTFRTLRKVPFVFGDKPTLADAALHGQALMLHEASPSLVGQVGAELAQHFERMRAHLAKS